MRVIALQVFNKLRFELNGVGVDFRIFVLLNYGWKMLKLCGNFQFSKIDSPVGETQKLLIMLSSPYSPPEILGESNLIHPTFG